MTEARKPTRKWWRYLLAGIVFVVISDFFPMIFAFIWSILEIFTPNYFKSGFAWTCILAYVATPFVAMNVSALIVGKDLSGKDSIFYVIVAVAWMVWCVFTAIKKYSAGIIVFEVACGFFAEAIILLIYAFVFIAAASGGKIKFPEKLLGKKTSTNTHKEV